MASGQGCFRKAFDEPLVLTEPTPRSIVPAARLRQTIRGVAGIAGKADVAAVGIVRRERAL